MAGRKIQDEQDALRCLAAARSSKGGLGGWARAHGVDGRSLNTWRVNLERRGVPRPTVRPRLVELVPAAASPSSAARYRLCVEGVELEFGDDFSEASLRRLIGLLKSC
jgi:hypothetical protein